MDNEPTTQHELYGKQNLSRHVDVVQQQKNNVIKLDGTYTREQIEKLNEVYPDFSFSVNGKGVQKPHFIFYAGLCIAERELRIGKNDLIIGASFTQTDNHRCWHIDARDQSRITRTLTYNENIDTHTLNSYMYTERGTKFCTEGVQNCRYKATRAVANNVYDIPVPELPNIFERHGLKVLDLAISLPPELFEDEDTHNTEYGFYLKHQDGFTTMDYDCGSNGYTHNTSTWRSWGDSLGIEGKTFNISIEKIKSFGPMCILRATRVTKGFTNTAVRKVLNSGKYKVPDLSGCEQQIIEVLDCKSQDVTIEEAKEKLDEITKDMTYIYVEAELVDKVMEHSLVRDDKHFNRHTVGSYLKSVKSTISIGFNTIQAGVKMDYETFEKVMTTLFLGSAIRRQFQTKTIGKVISTFVKSECQCTECQGKELIKKVACGTAAVSIVASIAAYTPVSPFNFDVPKQIANTAIATAAYHGYCYFNNIKPATIECAESILRKLGFNTCSEMSSWLVATAEKLTLTKVVDRRVTTICRHRRQNKLPIYEPRTDFYSGGDGDCFSKAISTQVYGIDKDPFIKPKSGETGLPMEFSFKTSTGHVQALLSPKTHCKHHRGYSCNIRRLYKYKSPYGLYMDDIQIPPLGDSPYVSDPKVEHRGEIYTGTQAKLVRAYQILGEPKDIALICASPGKDLPGIPFKVSFINLGPYEDEFAMTYAAENGSEIQYDLNLTCDNCELPKKPIYADLGLEVTDNQTLWSTQYEALTRLCGNGTSFVLKLQRFTLGAYSDNANFNRMLSLAAKIKLKIYKNNEGAEYFITNSNIKEIENIDKNDFRDNTYKRIMKGESVAEALLYQRSVFFSLPKLENYDSKIASNVTVLYEQEMAKINMHDFNKDCNTIYEVLKKYQNMDSTRRITIKVNYSKKKNEITLTDGENVLKFKNTARKCLKKSFAYFLKHTAEHVQGEVQESPEETENEEPGTDSDRNSDSSSGADSTQPDKTQEATPEEDSEEKESEVKEEKPDPIQEVLQEAPVVVEDRKLPEWYVEQEGAVPKCCGKNRYTLPRWAYTVKQYCRNSDFYSSHTNIKLKKLSNMIGPVVYKGKTYKALENAYQTFKNDLGQESKWQNMNPFTVKGENKNRRMCCHTCAIALMCQLQQIKYMDSFYSGVLFNTVHTNVREASPWDMFWGTGKTGKGHNYMGKILTALRDFMINDKPVQEDLREYDGGVISLDGRGKAKALTEPEKPKDCVHCAIISCSARPDYRATQRTYLETCVEPVRPEKTKIEHSAAFENTIYEAAQRSLVAEKNEFSELNAKILQLAASTQFKGGIYEIEGVTGVPGCGKTTNIKKFKPDDQIYITPYKRLAQEYIDAGYRAYTYAIGLEKVPKGTSIVLDEAFALEPLVALLYLKHYKVTVIGDPLQMRFVDKSNIYNKITAVDVFGTKFPHQNVSFTMPLDVTYVLNKKFDYRCTTMSTIYKSMELGHIDPQKQEHFCFTTRWESAKGNKSTVVAKIQGKRTKTTYLIGETACRAVVNNVVGQLVVALSRHSERMIVHTEDNLLKNIVNIAGKCTAEYKLEGPKKHINEGKQFYFRGASFEEVEDAPRAFKTQVHDHADALVENRNGQADKNVGVSEGRKLDELVSRVLDNLHKVKEDDSEEKNDKSTTKTVTVSVPSSAYSSQNAAGLHVFDTSFARDVVSEFPTNYKDTNEAITITEEPSLIAAAEVLQKISPTKNTHEHVSTLKSNSFPSFKGKIFDSEKITQDVPMTYTRLNLPLRGRRAVSHCANQALHATTSRYTVNKPYDKQLNPQQLLANILLALDPKKIKKYGLKISPEDISIAAAEMAAKIDKKGDSVTDWAYDPNCPKQSTYIKTFAKQQIRPDVSVESWIRLAENTYKSFQGVSAQPKAVNIIVAPFIRAVETKFKSLLRDNIKLGYSLSFEEKTQFARDFINDKDKACEMDIKELDSVRGAKSERCMEQLYKIFGVDTRIVKYMSLINKKWKYNGPSSSASIEYHFQSGRCDTLFSNTVDVMGRFFMFVKPQEMSFGLFQGDDATVFAKSFSYEELPDYIKFSTPTIPSFTSNLVSKYGVYPDFGRIMINLGNKNIGDKIVLEELRLAATCWLKGTHNNEQAYIAVLLNANKYGISSQEANILFSYLYAFSKGKIVADLDSKDLIQHHSFPLYVHNGPYEV